MKKLNSNQLTIITKVFAALTLITIALQVGLDWENWIEHPKMLWLPLLFMFISVIVSQKAKSKKIEEDSSNKK
jgi:Na+/glutamate symporter